MLGQRIITAVVLVALLLAALLWLPQAEWLLLVTAIALVAAYEWAQLSGYSNGVMLAYLMSVILIISFGNGWIPSDNETQAYRTFSVFLLSAIFWFAIAPLWLAYGYKLRQPILMGLTGWIVIIPTALTLIFLPRPFELLALMAVVWVSDIAAYFCGRAFGKHKLAPSISPGKTWEGVAGALIATLIYAEGLQRMGFSFRQTGAQGYSLKITALFLLLACLGILGDLFESWMKRTAGVKDSGHILPGHGGVLDRIDALTSTLPIAALVLGLMGGLH
jgi:phosphatidate cytidylyltransferase